MYKRIAMIICIVVLAGPLSSFGQSEKKTVSKISFDFMDADVRNVLRVLADVSGKNIVIADDVKGRVTMKLDNVSWEEALDVVIKSNELARLEEENIIRIVTSKRFVEERERDKRERLELLKEKEAKQKLEEDFVTETIPMNYADIIEVEKIVRGDATKKGLLTPNGAVTLVKWTNSIIIKDTKSNVEEIRKRLKEQDIKPAQIQIEARIVQATSNFSRDLGVQWGARYLWNSRAMGSKDVEITGSKNAPTTGGSGTRDTATLPYNVNFPAAIGGDAGGGSLGVYIGSIADSFWLDVQLSALESEGKGKILSHPKVVTSDSKTALVSQGSEIPYQTYSANQGTQTSFKDAVLSLEVTPKATRDGYVRMQIKAKKDAVDWTTSSTAGPPINKKEANTEVIVKDGETAVIGGIFETSRSHTESGIPFFRNLPLIGWLFRRDQTQEDKSELLIFITPTILKNLYTEGG